MQRKGLGTKFYQTLINKTMSKEDKNSRNVVLITILIGLIIILGLSSCGTTYHNTNPAYVGWNAGCGK